MTFRDRDETETRNLDQEIREIETETRVSSNPDVYPSNILLIAVSYLQEVRRHSVSQSILSKERREKFQAAESILPQDNSQSQDNYSADFSDNLSQR